MSSEKVCIQTQCKFVYKLEPVLYTNFFATLSDLFLFSGKYNKKLLAKAECCARSFYYNKQYPTIDRNNK